MNADGSDQHLLTTDTSPKDQLPEWSPDGSRIAYAARSLATGLDIWVMNADGTDQHAVMADSGDTYGPAWSPDGTGIAYVDATENTIETMDTQGDDVRCCSPAASPPCPPAAAGRRRGVSAPQNGAAPYRSGMDFGVLGPLVVTARGNRIEVPAPRSAPCSHTSWRTPAGWCPWATSRSPCGASAHPAHPPRHCRTTCAAAQRTRAGPGRRPTAAGDRRGWLPAGRRPGPARRRALRPPRDRGPPGAGP